MNEALKLLTQTYDDTLEAFGSTLELKDMKTAESIPAWKREPQLIVTCEKEIPCTVRTPIILYGYLTNAPAQVDTPVRTPSRGRPVPATRQQLAFSQRLLDLYECRTNRICVKDGMNFRTVLHHCKREVQRHRTVRGVNHSCPSAIRIDSIGSARRYKSRL